MFLTFLAGCHHHSMAYIYFRISHAARTLKQKERFIKKCEASALRAKESRIQLFKKGW